MRVQQIKRAITAEVLVLVGEIEREIQRAFVALAHHHKDDMPRK